MLLLVTNYPFRVQCFKQCCCATDLDLFPIPSPAVLFHPTLLSSSSVHGPDISIQGETIISSLCQRPCPELRQTFYPVSIYNDLFGY